MNIGVLLLVFIGGLTGVVSTAYMVVSLVATIAFKIFRTVRYHISLFD